MRSLYLAAVVAIGVLCVAACQAPAQQVTVGTPFHTLGDSFFERTGTNWGLNWDNGFLNFGSPGMATPQFGGFDPSAGINGGFAFRRDGLNGFFNFAAYSANWSD